MPYVVEGDLLCWIWTGYTDSRGTPVVRTPESQTTARRWHWEREHGPVPEGKILVAMCGEKLCVRPHHAEPMTRAEMMRRRGMVVLSPEQARRALLLRNGGVSRREVGRRFGVDGKTILEIEEGTHWTVREGADDGDRTQAVR